MKIKDLFESRQLLTENFSRGAQNVLKNKNLVMGIANQLRDDHTIDPKLSRQFRRMSDEECATWFVEQLDRMERAGIDGTVYGRDGQHHMWVANNYSKGGDLWEDIEGELPEAMRDYTILKNRNLLDDRHADYQLFKGVKELHRYMVQHYSRVLDEVRKDAAKAALIKNRRSILVVDNEDYRIYMLQNRAAAIAFGKGATFCTASTTTDQWWKSYSSRGPIFGLQPKTEPKPNTTGMAALGDTIVEKYQFDGGSGSFMNNMDRREDAEGIKERFPYLWYDLQNGIKQNSSEIEKPDDEPGVEKVSYNVQKAIDGLKNGLRQYWTEEKRPAVKPAAEPEVPAVEPPPATQ